MNGNGSGCIRTTRIIHITWRRAEALLEVSVLGASCELRQITQFWELRRTVPAPMALPTLRALITVFATYS